MQHHYAPPIDSTEPRKQTNKYTIGITRDISKRIRELAWIEKDVVASTEAQERCTMQFAQTVASRPRFHSSPTGPGQFIAAIATRSTGHPEEAFKEIYP